MERDVSVIKCSVDGMAKAGVCTGSPHIYTQDTVQYANDYLTTTHANVEGQLAAQQLSSATKHNLSSSDEKSTTSSQSATKHHASIKKAKRRLYQDADVPLGEDMYVSKEEDKQHISATLGQPDDTCSEKDYDSEFTAQFAL